VHSLIFEVGGPISALPAKANIREHDWHVRGVPTADISVAALWPINHKVGENCLEQSGRLIIPGTSRNSRQSDRSPSK
jgi:hypothetical protein